jgi:DNA polymerase III subunit alpha
LLDDGSGRLEVSMFEETFQQYRALIAKDSVVVVEGKIRFEDFIDDWRLNATRITDIDKACEQYARRLVIRWPDNVTNGSGAKFIQHLQQLLSPYRKGQCSVQVNYRANEARAALTLPDEWSVRPSRELIDKLRQLVGGDGVQVHYAVRNEGG